MYNNINGYVSKKESLAKSVESSDPDIIALCETKKAGRISEEELSAYKTIEKNLKQGKEGILLGVRKGTFDTMKEITDTELKNLLTVKIVYPLVNLRIIIVHAPQETDSQDKRLEFFEELSVQVERGLTSGDELLVVGDLNARIGMDSNGKVIPESTSPNGKQLCELIERHSLKVGNFHQSCSGKWTRIQPQKDGSIKKSALDYVLMPANMHQALKSFVIDEDKIYCPFREITTKGRKHIVYSDHCVMTADIELNVGQVRRKSEKVSGWKYCDEGYELYSIESNLPMEFEAGEPNTTKMYESWVVAFEKVLSNCFRRRTFRNRANKVKTNKKHAHIREILSETSKQGRIQRSIVKQYQKALVEAECRKMAAARAERLKKTTSNLTTNEKFSPVGYWKMKKAADKGIRKDQTISSIVTAQGVEIDCEKAIVEAYQMEFEKRLGNRKPEKGWEEYTEKTNTVLRNWLEEDSYSSPPFSNEELDAVLSTLKPGAPGVDNYPPKLFAKAGTGVTQSILQLCNGIKKSREIPEQWNLVKIVTIYKQKGSRKELKNYRGIFLTIVISKIFEKLVKTRIEIRLCNINLLQAGSRKNRGPADNVYLFRAVLDHYKFTKKKLFITAYDFEQAFDSLWLEDCVLSLKELGVEKEYLQLIYNLNKKAGVTVQTPLGPTSVFNTDPIVKQGTVLGPCLCSSSTGEYCGVNPGVSVGSTIISSLLYVDDVIDMSTSVEDYLQAHQNALLFKKRKKVKHSGTKCFSMIMNEKPKDEKPPLLMLDAVSHVILTAVITYLGDVFNSSGNNDGLIADRVKRGTKAMITIASLMAETDVGIHHISIMLLLYHALFLSTILFNSGTWSNLRKKDLESLRTLQLKYLKRSIGVASSTANAFVFLELGVLPIEFEIEKRQLMYLHRILQLQSEDPVLKVFHEQRRMNEAGEKNWWSGVEPCLRKYSLPLDLNVIKTMSKDCFAKKVKTAITETALHQLVSECQSLKKTSKLQYEDLKLQHYMMHLFPSQARTVFKWRSETLDLKTHLTYKYADTVCRNCKGEDETPNHALNCGFENRMEAEIEILELGELDDLTKSELKRMVSRINSFLQKVSTDGE